MDIPELNPLCALYSRCVLYQNALFQDFPSATKTLVSGSESLLENRTLGGNDADTTQIPYQVNNYA
jgi:hypothetical protein